MKPLNRTARLAAPILATAGLCACNGSVTVNLIDTPVDGATSVVVDFTGVVLHNTNGRTTTITFATARQIDLLQLQNGVMQALLQNQSVPSGNYDWMQLDVLATANTQGQSYITLDTGAQYPLYVPSGSQTALKLTTPFSVGQGGGATQLLIEFDLRQSVTGTDGQNYTLVPAMRLENASQVGTISATVDLAALARQQLGSGAQISQCSPGLFVFSGSSVTPQNGGGASLVDFQPIAYNGGTQAALSFPHLSQGSYTVAATCDYGLYDPTAVPGQSGYQALHWTVLPNVSVTANSTTTDSLPAGTASSVIVN